MKFFNYIFAVFITLAVPPWAWAGTNLNSFELIDNRMIIQVTINGHGPYHMMFDTGATNILSEELAHNLGVSTYNRFPISGGGENTVYGSYCNVKKLGLFSQNLQNLRFICMSLNEMKKAIGFPKLDGLIGYEVFSQFLTEIDFDKMQITLKPFAERSRLQAGEVVPFTFDGPTPVIEAVLDGVPGRFWLDTGDRASLTLSLPFIANSQLMQKYKPTFSMMTGYGLGGPLKTALAFADSVSISGLIFSNTLIRLPTTNSKALNIPGFAGTLGMGILRQFNMVIDYSRKELILTKNSAYEQDRAVDRSGLWISPSPEGFQIRDVLENGPGWNAGLRKNHVILEVNKVTISELDIFKLREQLKDRNTQELELLVQEGAKTFKTILYLKDLL